MNRLQVSLQSREDTVKVRGERGILVRTSSPCTNQLIIVNVNGNSEEESCIAPIYKLVVVELDEGGVLAVA